MEYCEQNFPNTFEMRNKMGKFLETYKLLALIQDKKEKVQIDLHLFKKMYILKSFYKET